MKSRRSFLEVKCLCRPSPAAYPFTPETPSPHQPVTLSYSSLQRLPPYVSDRTIPQHDRLRGPSGRAARQVSLGRRNLGTCCRMELLPFYIMAVGPRGPRVSALCLSTSSIQPQSSPMKVLSSLPLYAPQSPFSVILHISPSRKRHVPIV